MHPKAHVVIVLRYRMWLVLVAQGGLEPGRLRRAFTSALKFSERTKEMTRKHCAKTINQ